MSGGVHIFSGDGLGAFVVVLEALKRALILAEASADCERQQRRLAEQLQMALDTRIIIEQAKGMVSARRSIPPNEAFNCIRSYSRSHSRDIHDVAHAIVQGRLLV